MFFIFLFYILIYEIIEKHLNINLIFFQVNNNLKTENTTILSYIKFLFKNIVAIKFSLNHKTKTFGYTIKTVFKNVNPTNN
jgi:hypothetical protein